ncbi:TetR/AcrR family transcriptional regulator [Streptomyces subrutilus]|uniref:TetR family transcriptional regulator n=1 Tax=Streptomyces subrutilus TaxID=36818 RepID=A0A5P2UPN3_9ACTN|nr:TetR/AcrR family transcriptional regulator [Streptomyces subrutilus]QEU81296.1 TetR/AcrR family transcriptional regulator [Streptomyces subrutilus]WSJ29375.1 TetR/AcrR family transcriptional regulator [Streptomyces subrutilus]GGZ85582.1 TetR family transcriptional regulator [Streptomyces subrutilus]
MDSAEETAEGYRPWSEVTPDAARRLLVAAVEAFAERGYHATTTRDIAGRAGMSPAALYIHYKTKEELLHRISRIGHDKALEILATAAEAPGSAAGRLDAAVRSFVRWHAAHHTTARVVQYELDALAPEHRSEIVALRRRSDAAVRRMLAEGVASGEFDVPDVPGTTLAVLSLCIDVARWFSADGRRTPDEVGALYADLVLRMVGARTPGPRTPGSPT